MTGKTKFFALDKPAMPAGASTQDPSQPTVTADEVLQLARQLLERGRSEQALAVIAQYAAAKPVERPVHIEPQLVFDAGVTDQELELAFESAESDRGQMLDADEIAERAIRQTDSEIHDRVENPDRQDDFVEFGASYATRTVAKLLERQGDAPTASRIRAFVDSSIGSSVGSSVGSSEQNTAFPAGSPPAITGRSKPPVRDRRTATIMELERWLTNLRGVAR